MGRHPMLGKNASNKIEDYMIWKILFELFKNKELLPRTLLTSTLPLP